MASVWKSLLVWLATMSVVVVARVPTNTALRTRNIPGTSDADTLEVVGRALQLARLQSRDDKFSMNKTSFAKTWVGATLFQYGDETSNDTTVGSHDASLEVSADIEIICATCYVRGSVTGDLTLTGDFNFTAALDGVESELENVTVSALDQLESYAKEVFEDIGQDVITSSGTPLPAFPPLDVALDLNNSTGFPGASIHFEFDDLEFYLELDIKLSTGATYTLNLYTSETPAGFAVPGLDLGAVFSLDLILISDAEIDIGSGIHVKFDGGLAFDLEMFNSNVSYATVPGGNYEFLPVTISGEGSIQAILSLKASLGCEVETSAVMSALDFSAGVEADVFAYVADFALQVNSSTATEKPDCELLAVAEYTFAVGAAAGATMVYTSGKHHDSWGPSPSTTIPVWYTTLASLCATSKTSISTAALITARAELGQGESSSSFLTTTSTQTYQIVNCLSQGLINCPVTLQNTTSYQAVVTNVLDIQSGSTITFPASGVSALATGIPFGSNSNKLVATSGTPTSYVPPSPTSTTAGGFSSSTGSSIDGWLTGHSNGTSNKLIIGLSVGLGVPFLTIVVAGLWYCIRRHRKYSEVAQQDSAGRSPDLSEQYSPVSPGMMKNSPLISVRSSD